MAMFQFSACVLHARNFVSKFIEMGRADLFIGDASSYGVTSLLLAAVYPRPPGGCFWNRSDRIHHQQEWLMIRVALVPVGESSALGVVRHQKCHQDFENHGASQVREVIDSARRPISRKMEWHR
jgi:hypothetical protein